MRKDFSSVHVCACKKDFYIVVTTHMLPERHNSLSIYYALFAFWHQRRRNRDHHHPANQSLKKSTKSLCSLLLQQAIQDNIRFQRIFVWIAVAQQKSLVLQLCAQGYIRCITYPRLILYKNMPFRQMRVCSYEKN